MTEKLTTTTNNYHHVTFNLAGIMSKVTSQWIHISDKHDLSLAVTFTSFK